LPGAPGVSTTFRLGYRPSLDGLRGLGGLAVLLCHFGLIPGGFIGVDLLFVLSGFLITILLVEEYQKKGSISLPAFFGRRFLRLLPALVALLLVIVLTTILHRPSGVREVLKESAITLGFVANWHTIHQVALPNFGHTWSLSLEIQFYVLWVVLLAVLLKANVSKGRILTLTVAAALASAVWRALLFLMRPPNGPARDQFTMRLFTGLDTRADVLLIGCLAGLLVAWNLVPRSNRSRRLLGLGAAISTAVLGHMLLHSCLDHHQFYKGLFLLVALMLGILLVFLTTNPPRIVLYVLERPVLTGLGRVSYSLYLLHLPIMFALAPTPGNIGWKAPLTTVLGIGLSLAAAVLSFCFIERPCLRLKLDTRRSGQSAPPLRQAA
jgi:peptidoglycan/LPS O-acetylase OafA/YrhL